jgi:hypothetical protein
LYVCTAPTGDTTPGSASGWCMEVASMSPLIEYPRDREEWHCARCRAQRPASGSRSVPRRVLRLYPLVSTGRIPWTPLRSGHIVAVVYPPPPAFCWPGGKPRTAVPQAPPEPRSSKSGGKLVYEYELEASNLIWQSASSFDPSPTLG